MGRNIITVKGTALVEVEYNYEILDIEKFNQEISENRESLQSLSDLWGEGLLRIDDEVIKYVGKDFVEIVRDHTYDEIYGWSEDVEKVIEENHLDELDEWNEF